MSKRCAVTGVKSMKGNSRSHSLRATIKTWKANLQKVKVVDEKTGEVKTEYVSARAIKRGMVKRA